MPEVDLRHTQPILQLHASRHCNLACRHCYSMSGPREKGSLAGDLLGTLFEDACAEGYRIVSISGGEPLMDPAFRDQVRAARLCGFEVNVVSNGMLIDPPTAEWMAAHIGVTAVSIDGPPEMHDALRGAAGAFQKALSGIRTLRSCGARVALLHTARQVSLAHLRWLVCLARDEGVELVQIHPLEMTGRARRDLQDEATADLASRSALIAEILRREFPTPALQVDVLPLDLLAGATCEAAPGERPLGELLDPLVVEADGTVVPWTHGIDRRLQLGNIHDARLAELCARYRSGGLRSAFRHQRRVRDALTAGPPWPYVNWFAALAAPVASEGLIATSPAEAADRASAGHV